MIQYRDIQNATDLFQNFVWNLFWTQMFLLEFLEANLSEF